MTAVSHIREIDKREVSVDTYFLILAIALLLTMIGFVWLVVVGFKRSILWGILIFLLSPFSAIAFAFTNWYEAKYAFLLHMLSLMAFFGVGYVLIVDEIGLERIQKVSTAMESGQIKDNEFFLYLDPNTLLPGEEDEETEAGIDLDGDGIIDTPQTVITGEEKVTTVGEKGDADTNVEAEVTEITKLTESKGGEELEVIITEEKKPQLDYPTPGNITADPLVTPKKKVESGSVRVKLSKINHYVGRYFIVTTKKGNQHRGILVKVTKSRIILERKIYGGTFKYKVSKKNIKRLDMFKKEYIEELS